MRVRIDCINKNPRLDPYHAITHAGGVNYDGTPWKLPLAEAVAGAERGEWQFYVERGGRTVDVIVVSHANGHKFLKTVADYSTPDNLLSLDECP